jgi:large repetitive protein
VSISSSPTALTKETSATFSFSSNKMSSTFTCQLDGREPAPCTSPVSYAALVRGTHTFTVGATDPAGNASAPTSFAWTIDTTLPGAAIVSGPASLTNRTSATFTFSSSKPGSAYFCAIDGAAAFDSCSNPATISGLSDGRHTFAVRASDELGNVDPVPATYGWTVDTVLPATTITSRPPAVTTKTTATLTFSSTKPGATFECELDAASDFTACGSPLLLTDLAVGNHAIHVRARDAIGNIDSSPPSYIWTIVRQADPVLAGGCSSDGAPSASILAWVAAAFLGRAASRRRASRKHPRGRDSVQSPP